MTAVALVGGKGSPGTTTLALALATVISTEDPLLVEVDPAGGDLAARFGRSLDPGLLSLAAAGRRGLTMELIASHSQVIAANTRVLLAPTSLEQASSVLRGVAPGLACTLAKAPDSVILDGGRWDASSEVAEFVRQASITLLVVRPTIEGIEHARWQLASLRTHASKTAAVSIGDRPYPPHEVQAALGVEDLYVVDDDMRAARSLANSTTPDRWLRRSPLLRSTTVLVESLRAHGACPAVSG